jgi:hypothetical protein
MPRIPQGPAIRGSQKWIQKLVNEKPDLINSLIKIQLQLAETEEITWYSPLAEDELAEYQDQAFLELVNIELPNASLSDFWPSKSGSQQSVQPVYIPHVILSATK